MMMPMLVTTVKICGWWMLTTRIASASTPMITAGSTGVWKRGLTRASSEDGGQVVVPGHREHQPDRRRVDGQRADGDRDQRRTTASPCPTVGPSRRARRTAGRPCDSCFALQAGDAHQREEQDQAADEEGGDDRPQDGARRVAARVMDSSPSEDAVSKPYMTYAEASEAARNAPR